MAVIDGGERSVNQRALDRMVRKGARTLGLHMTEEQVHAVTGAAMLGVWDTLRTARLDRDDEIRAQAAGIRELLAQRRRDEIARRWWSPEAFAARRAELAGRLGWLRARDSRDPLAEQS